MRKLKICILTSIFPKFEKDTRGIFIFHNTTALAETGVEVHVIAPSTEDAKDFEVINGVNIYRFRYWFSKKHQKVAYGEGIPKNLRKSKLARIQLPFFLLSFIWKSLIIGRKCDIVHAQWIQTAFAGLFLQLFFKVPLLISIRGTDIRVNRSGSLMEKITRFILNRASSIISLAPGESKLAKNLGNYDIIEMHNPLDGDRFNPNIPIDGLKNEFSLESERIVSFIGRLSKEKDPFTFIEAISRVVKQIDNVVFFIVGYGALKEEIEARVRELNLGQQIFITGNRNDTNIFHAASDIFVSLGIYENLWSNALIEALASGRACIVTDAGETSSCLTHMKNAYLIPPENPKALAQAMIELLNNRNLREKLSKNAELYIKQNHFYKEDVVTKLVEIYKKLLT